MSKDEYLITDAPLKALTVFAMPMILGSFFQQVYNLSLIHILSSRGVNWLLRSIIKWAQTITVEYLIDLLQMQI